jgi:hypothetical protein
MVRYGGGNEQAFRTSESRCAKTSDAGIVCVNYGLTVEWESTSGQVYQSIGRWKRLSRLESEEQPSASRPRKPEPYFPPNLPLMNSVIPRSR